MLSKSAEYQVILLAALALATLSGYQARAVEHNGQARPTHPMHHRRLHQANADGEVFSAFDFTVGNNVTDDSVAWVRAPSSSSDTAVSPLQMSHDWPSLSGLLCAIAHCF